ncbi:sulfonate ABC transporter permease [Candidatus Legionella polyplacis]|uniref:ABC transporter permease n=1 Tax=Candidatus Legionella polyplacis TaxID=2005262 RepID=UPI000C1DE532|nr:ABC transporter permease subunit [Candidatus Legionella polyplacis]ATW02087.1 sulfonate ABC transporter permease [Candidatus Legionella polyplacis]
MVYPYKIGQKLPISLSLFKLPLYSLRTVLRMFIALILSILFTFVFGTFAAKSNKAEKIIIPLIDILQSVPVLSFVSITVNSFVYLFPGCLLGAEFASIFAIFTAQVWNIVLGFYQSLRLLPNDLKEVAEIFQLSAWQKFWKIEVPFSISNLLWNIMISMSSSWFFVVVSEAISIAHYSIHLPGIGSYIALAIECRDLLAVCYSIFAMVIIIFLCDQILFRPLIVWSEKFKIKQCINEDEYKSWLINLMRSGILIKIIYKKICIFKDHFINTYWIKKVYIKKFNFVKFLYLKQINWLLNFFILIFIGTIIWVLIKFVLMKFNLIEIFHVCLLGAITSIRVLVLIVISSLIWIPIGVYIGLNPKFSQKIQPVIQFVSSIPANLFYPLFVIIIVYFHLNTEIFLTPLMILGMQWYILFNVIAGASNIPSDLRLVADNFNLTGWKWWKRLVFPSIFPFYITGAITASGGAWNASVVSEYVSWGNIVLKANGLGGYIQTNIIDNNFSKVILGTIIMCIYVLMFNHLIWKPLYRLAKNRCCLF